MKVLITGATGTAGVDIVKTVLARQEITSVIAIVRNDKNLPFGPHPKLSIKVLQDFKDIATLKLHQENYGAVLWCLGISQTQVSKERYYEITHDYTIDAANELLKSLTTPVFCFLSGQGTSKDAWTRFGKVKYQTEQELFSLFPEGKVYSFRPGFIHPSKRTRAPGSMRIIVGIADKMAPFMHRYTPTMISDSAQIGNAMINAVLYGSKIKILENMDIRNLAAQKNC